MSYLLKDRSRPDIIRVTDLAKAVHTNLKNQVSVYTAENCADIYLSCSSVFLSCATIIDGLDMNEPYRTAQSIPYPTTTTTSAKVD